MDSVLNAIYHGNIYPAEQIPFTKQMKDAIKEVSKLKESLMTKLDDEGKEMVEKLIANYYEYISLFSRETFLYAIKLGANLMIELSGKGFMDETEN